MRLPATCARRPPARPRCSDAGLDLTIFRPSVIFGRGDSFLTLFARMAKIAPFFPLAGADARFQPIWVEDVAAVVADSLGNSQSMGAAYDLCGPTQYALAELVRYATAVSGHPRAVIGIPEFVGWLQAWAMEFIPNGPMTRDNIRSMRVPSTCEAAAAACPSVASPRRWKSSRRRICVTDGADG
jgi:uncharacterized protein YbjT (DUF2867 family)